MELGKELPKMRNGILGLVLGFALTSGQGCASALESFEGPIVPLDLAVCSPEGEFTLESTNPYFPIEVGKRWTLEGGDERVQITVLDETEVVAGVITRVVEEREWQDGKQKEVSRNFFAQASDGTVCYFGEEVDPEEGVWRADSPGSRPGIIMPGDPKLGMRFQMEVAPGLATDEGVVIEVGKTIKVPAGTFTETIVVLEVNPLEGEEEPKVFAPGVGLLVDEDLELVSY
jgi:hypothetical protein